ncbi:MAG: hypothetical protein IPO21_20680 [Bacteroidales bacterium]|nr:hypothetical protein [Bacteroidales bacterium]
MKKIVLLAKLLLAVFVGFSQNLDISGGYGSSAMICSNGDVYTWGNNKAGDAPNIQRGILGRGVTGDNDPTPGIVTYFRDNSIYIKAVDAGSGGHLALDCNGNVYSWGQNNYEQTGQANPNGLGNNHVVSLPSLVPGLSNIVYVSAGNDESYVIDATGRVLTWGQNDKGQLGNGTITNSRTPIVVQGISGKVLKVEAGDETGYALTTDGRVYSWGAGAKDNTGTYGGTGMLGRVAETVNAGVSSYRAGVVLKPDGTPLTDIVEISAGDVHCLAIDASGQVWGWGNNGWAGQVGTGEGDNIFFAKKAVGLGGIGFLKATKITAGRAHSVAVLDNGTAVGWGLNSGTSKCSYGNVTESKIPVLIPGLSNIKDVSDGDGWTFFIKADGSFQVMGGNEFGQTGTGAVNPSVCSPQL